MISKMKLSKCLKGKKQSFLTNLNNFYSWDIEQHNLEKAKIAEMQYHTEQQHLLNSGNGINCLHN